MRPSLERQGPVPAWRWAVWWGLLGAAVVVFYVLLTPIWLGIRAVAWLSDRRARRTEPRDA